MHSSISWDPNVFASPILQVLPKQDKQDIDIFLLVHVYKALPLYTKLLEGTFSSGYDMSTVVVMVGGAWFS